MLRKFCILFWSLFLLGLPAWSNCLGNCTGNMNIARWRPVFYPERPIFPLRGCNSFSCQKGWRSAIINPPPQIQYGGQVFSGASMGCRRPIPPANYNPFYFSNYAQSNSRY